MPYSSAVFWASLKSTARDVKSILFPITVYFGKKNDYFAYSIKTTRKKNIPLTNHRNIFTVFHSFYLKKNRKKLYQIGKFLITYNLKQLAIFYVYGNNNLEIKRIGILDTF